MGFYGIDGDEEFVGDLLVGVTLGHEFEDFVFAFADAEFFESCGVELEVGGGDDDGFFAGEFESGPYSDGSEDDGENAEVEFDGEVAHDELILQGFEEQDECGEGEAV